jgi:hypothetical protein
VALWAESKVMLHALEDVVERQAGELAFGEFADVLQAFAAIEFTVSRLVDHADNACDLLGRKRFHRANAVRISKAVIPSAAR